MISTEEHKEATPTYAEGGTWMSHLLRKSLPLHHFDMAFNLYYFEYIVIRACSAHCLFLSVGLLSCHSKFAHFLCSVAHYNVLSSALFNQSL